MKLRHDPLFTAGQMRDPKAAWVSQAVVEKALAAYEGAPPLAGREERMRRAIAAVGSPRSDDEPSA